MPFDVTPDTDLFAIQPSASLGGTTNEANLAIKNLDGKYNPGQQGVFALHPLMTPKYAKNKGSRDNEYRDTLSRMYLSLAGADSNAKEKYLASFSEDPTAYALAQVLIGVNSSTGGTGFIDFFLDQIREQWQEKVQISELLSDNYVAYFFGQAPPIFTFSGNLLN